MVFCAFADAPAVVDFCGVALASEAGAVSTDGVPTGVESAAGAAPLDFRARCFFTPLAVGADWLSTGATMAAGAEGAGDADAAVPLLANSRLAFLFSLGASPSFDPGAGESVWEVAAEAEAGASLLLLRFLRLWPFSAVAVDEAAAASDCALASCLAFLDCRAFFFAWELACGSS